MGLLGGVADGAVQGTVIYATDSTGTARGINEPPQVSDSLRLGVWTWTPQRTLAPLTLAALNTVRMDVRLGSVSYVAATRSGATVTVAARSYRYWTSTHAFATWGRATGVIEWRAPGTSTWHGLKKRHRGQHRTLLLPLHRHGRAGLPRPDV